MEAIASRYALALSKLAHEQASLSPYLIAIHTTLDALDHAPDLLPFLQNEFYSRVDKMKIIDTFFLNFESFMISSLCKVMLDKRRIKYFKTSLILASQLIQSALNQQQGIVYSVTPLSPEQLLALEKALSDHLGKTITLANQINQQLIGGIRIDIQGKVYDASLQDKLANLKHQLQQRGM
jgi:F-type H+-transporting ATPase subunit delta